MKRRFPRAGESPFCNLLGISALAASQRPTSESQRPSSEAKDRHPKAKPSAPLSLHLPDGAVQPVELLVVALDYPFDGTVKCQVDVLVDIRCYRPHSIVE